MTPDQLAKLTRLHKAATPPPWGAITCGNTEEQLIVAARNALPELLHNAAIVGPLESLLETRGRVTIHRMWHPKDAVSIRLGHVGKELFYGPDLATALAAAEQAAKEGA